jgi:5-formyltetrahydrofolate cyclo-ligase
VASTKAELRRRVRAARGSRAPDPNEPAGLLAALRGAGLLAPGPAGAGPGDGPGDGSGPAGGPVVAAYVAAPGEPDPAAVRAAVRAGGGRVLLPIPKPDRQLEWAVDDGRYAPAADLPVPVPAGPPIGQGAECLIEAAVGLVLVPALAVDASGTRLGQGGGFYDTLLADLARLAADARRSPDGAAGRVRAPIAVLAVVHAEEVLPAGAIPRDAHDIPLGSALTSAGVVNLGRC